MRVLLFGAGDYYERYKKWFNEDDVLALLDNSLQKQNTRIDGIRVLSPAEGVKLSFDVVVVLSFYVKEMRSQLLELGVPEEKIYHFYDLNKLVYSRDKKKPIQYYGKAEEIMKLDVDSSEKILLLSQDMTLGGPALALFHAAEILIKHGHQVVFASMLDGPLKELLLLHNIPVIVDVNLQIETMTDSDWVKGFSKVICNTINFHVFLSDRILSIPVIWWLHDSEFFYDGINKSILQKLDKSNLKVVSVGPVPEKAIRKFIPDILIGRLLYGVKDMENKVQCACHKKDKIIFVTIGYIEARKGQDILLQAIQLLPEEIRRRAKFYFVGQNSSRMAKEIQNEIEYLPEIIMMGTVNRDKINEILRKADVLICPSREDPMPTVVAEAMMHSVPCIVSDSIGTAEYIKDGENGFVFNNGNRRELAVKIEWCIQNYEMIQQIGIKSREVYDKYFSMDAFEKNFINLIEETK